MSAGYSGTPLAKKLGYRPGTRALLVGAPGDYRTLVAPLPDGVVFARAPSNVDLVHFFTKGRAALERELPRLTGTIGQGGAIWVSWPKKAAKIPTDVTEDVVREVALPLGLVDVKVCAVDDIWSGLKLVVRKNRR